MIERSKDVAADLLEQSTQNTRWWPPEKQYVSREPSLAYHPSSDLALSADT